MEKAPTRAVVAAFNQGKALVGAFYLNVTTDCETDGSFTALGRRPRQGRHIPLPTTTNFLFHRPTAAPRRRGCVQWNPHRLVRVGSSFKCQGKTCDCVADDVYRTPIRK